MKQRKLAPPSVDLPDGVEQDAHWVFAKVDKYGKRDKRKRLRPGDNVIGYDYICQGHRRKYRVKVRYESSSLPRPWLWVYNYAKDEHEAPFYKTFEFSYGVLDYPVVCRAVVGYLPITADGWDPKNFHIYECTKVRPCVMCLRYHRLEEVEYVHSVEYRGYLWHFSRVFLPRCATLANRENAPTWINSGGFICVKCHEQVRQLACSIIDLDLTIEFIKQECLDVTNGRKSFVSLRSANRRSVSQRHGGANATFVGNVSRLARETFDRG